MNGGEAPILIIDRINSDLERVLKHQEVVLNTTLQHTLQGFHHYVQNGILSIKSGKSYRDLHV
jgi:hypothetical protein